MSKKQKKITVAIVVGIVVVSIMILFFVNHNKSDNKDISTTENTMAQWVEEYNYNQEDVTILDGYEDVSLPPITLEQ